MLDNYEQEQIDNLKDWWNRHGAKVTLAVTIVAVLGAGWNVWRYYQAKQINEATLTFEELQAAVQHHNVDKVRALAGVLMDHYSHTPLAVDGAMLAAKDNYGHNDGKSALAQLQWALDHAGSAAKRDMIRLQLAGVLLDQKKYPEAQAQVQQPETQAFAALFLQTQGDIQYAQGHRSEAVNDWKAALDKTQKTDQMRQLIKMKIDQLG